MNRYDINDISSLLFNNSYVGRGIIVGKSADGKNSVFAYFIMGRSENSRNRIFVENGDELLIMPYDESKVTDPSLIIYSPIKHYKNFDIVTNGDQTNTIYDYLKSDSTVYEALQTRCFEPDSPNFTPRISSVITYGDKDFSYNMSILKSTDSEGTVCEHCYYDYQSISGLGHFIHTYENDGTPLPSFSGEPKRVKIPDYIDIFADEIWNNLNYNNKISLYVRYTDLKTNASVSRLFNKNI